MKTGLRKRDAVYIGKRMLKMELPGKWKIKRGRPKRRFMNVLQGDTRVVDVIEKDLEARRDANR